MARIGVAVPWIVFAIVIVVLGGIPFALAMIGLSMIGMAELFRMTRRFHPLPPVALAAAVALVIAAYYGGQFQMIIVLAATFPVMFLFAAARGPREGGTTSAIAVTLLAILWIAVPFAHAVLLRQLPLHGGALVIDVLVATFLTDTAAYAAAGCSAATRSPRGSRPTRRSRASRSASSAGRWASGSPASTRTGCRASTR